MKFPSNPTIRLGESATSRIRRQLAFVILALCPALALAVTPLPDDPACTAADRKFMLRANELAAGAAGHGNGAYGAILVKDGKIIGEFETCGITTSDPTMH